VLLVCAVIADLFRNLLVFFPFLKKNHKNISKKVCRIKKSCIFVLSLITIFFNLKIKFIMSKKLKVVLSVCAAIIIAVVAINLNLAFKSNSIANLSLKDVVSLANAEDGGGSWFSRKIKTSLGTHEFCQGGALYVCTDTRIECEGFGIFVICNPGIEHNYLKYPDYPGCN
jgi:hypothetical protein